MAKLTETIKISVDTLELDHAKDLIKEIRKLGVKKKTLNLLIKSIAMAAEEIEPIEPIVKPMRKLTTEEIETIRRDYHGGRVGR